MQGLRKGVNDGGGGNPYEPSGEQKASDLILAIVERNNAILLEQMSAMIDARDTALMERVHRLVATSSTSTTGDVDDDVDDGGGTIPRRLQDSCTTGTSSSNANVQKASLWLRGPDEDSAGGRIVLGAAADVNLYRSAAETLTTDKKMSVGDSLSVGGDVTLSKTLGAADKITAPEFCIGNSCVTEWSSGGGSGRAKAAAPSRGRRATSASARRRRRTLWTSTGT